MVAPPTASGMDVCGVSDSSPLVVAAIVCTFDAVGAVVGSLTIVRSGVGALVGMVGSVAPKRRLLMMEPSP